MEHSTLPGAATGHPIDEPKYGVEHYENGRMVIVWDPDETDIGMSGHLDAIAERWGGASISYLQGRVDQLEDWFAAWMKLRAEAGPAAGGSP